MADVPEARRLIAELCALFYDQGWVSGTGGGISIKSLDGNIVMVGGWEGVQVVCRLPSLAALAALASDAPATCMPGCCGGCVRKLRRRCACTRAVGGRQTLLGRPHAPALPIAPT